MRRVLLVILGILEGTVAVVLVLLGYHLPSREEVGQGFNSADRITSDAGNQVRILRRQVQDLRRPDLQQVLLNLHKQSQNVAVTLRTQQIDFDTAGSMRDAFGELGDGLESLSRNLDVIDKNIETQKSKTELRNMLFRSATLLKTARNQMDQALEFRQDYESVLGQSLGVIEAFIAFLPLITEQLDNRLAEEEHALNELDRSLNEVHSALPVYAHATTQVVQGGKLLAWLGACIAGLHAIYLVGSARMGRRLAT